MVALEAGPASHPKLLSIAGVDPEQNSKSRKLMELTRHFSPKEFQWTAALTPAGVEPHSIHLWTGVIGITKIIAQVVSE